MIFSSTLNLKKKADACPNAELGFSSKHLSTKYLHATFFNSEILVSSVKCLQAAGETNALRKQEESDDTEDQSEAVCLCTFLKATTPVGRSSSCAG